MSGPPTSLTRLATEVAPKGDSGSPPPEFPPDYFMPYCVCPYCHVEALHWLRAPSPGFRIPKGPPTLLGTGWAPRTVVEQERVSEATYDVIRTCRECDRVWGQNVFGIPPKVEYTPPPFGPWSEHPKAPLLEWDHDAGMAKRTVDGQIVAIIKDRLESGKITPTQARTLAEDYLPSPLPLATPRPSLGVPAELSSYWKNQLHIRPQQGDTSL